MFQKYQYVLAVYREGSFTKAADRLFISQPSLSVAIRNIEKRIGMPLFERGGATVQLTEAGEAYIEAAQKMQFAEEAFARQMEDLNELRTGTLVVGGSNYKISDILPQLVSSFREQYPGVDVTLVEANSVHLREMLNTGEVDLVLDNFEGFEEQYALQPVLEEQIMLCVPPKYNRHKALAGCRILPESLYKKETCVSEVAPVNIAAFRDEPFVLLKSGNDMRERAMRMFESSGVTVTEVFSVDQLNISYALAESGLGVCFVTDTFFKYRKHTTDVVLYKLDHQLARRTLHVAYKKGRYCTKAMRKFTDILCDTIGE